MEKHLEQSVLSRLPNGYQSILKQSIASEEDDMGTLLCAFYSMLISIILLSVCVCMWWIVFGSRLQVSPISALLFKSISLRNRFFECSTYSPKL